MNHSAIKLKFYALLAISLGIAACATQHVSDKYPISLNDPLKIALMNSLIARLNAVENISRWGGPFTRENFGDVASGGGAGFYFHGHISANDICNPQRTILMEGMVPFDATIWTKSDLAEYAAHSLPRDSPFTVTGASDFISDKALAEAYSQWASAKSGIRSSRYARVDASGQITAQERRRCNILSVEYPSSDTAIIWQGRPYLLREGYSIHLKKTPDGWKTDYITDESTGVEMRAAWSYYPDRSHKWTNLEFGLTDDPVSLPVSPTVVDELRAILDEAACVNLPVREIDNISFTFGADAAMTRAAIRTKAPSRLLPDKAVLMRRMDSQWTPIAQCDIAINNTYDEQLRADRNYTVMRHFPMQELLTPYKRPGPNDIEALRRETGPAGSEWWNPRHDGKIPPEDFMQIAPMAMEIAGWSVASARMHDDGAVSWDNTNGLCLVFEKKNGYWRIVGVSQIQFGLVM